jgi:hypothetical protein
LPGGELIDRLQNIAGNIADCQYLNSRRLPHNETVSIIAMRVSNEYRSPAGINR